MKRVAFFILLTTIGIWATGCARITSQVVEKPRVDQELKGNRGYLVGAAPAEGNRKQTRQMVQTNIELPTLKELLPWKLQKEALAPAAPIAAKPMPTEILPEDQGAPFEEEQEAAPPAARPAASKVKPSVEEAEPSVGSTPYTVQKGDTLEKIAAKVYGDSSQWRRIFKANQEKLKSPSRIYPGQKLVIPPAEGERKQRSQWPEGLK